MRRFFYLTTLLICMIGFDHVLAKPSRLIVVSIPPMQYLMERLVGEEVTVISLVPTNGSPELYEPTSKQLIMMKNAELYFSLGLNFEKKWLSVIRENNSDLLIENCCDDLKTITVTEHSDTEHGDKDPHIWTDPLLTIEITRRMKNQLSKLYEGDQIEFEKQFSKLEEELLLIDSELTGLANRLEKRKFIVSHPAWTYFAKRYSLEQLSLEQDGKESGARARTKLIELAKQNHINTVFNQLQVNSRSAELFADEIHAELILLNPLEYDHLSNLRTTAKLIIGSLRN